MPLLSFKKIRHCYDSKWRKQMFWSEIKKNVPRIMENVSKKTFSEKTCFDKSSNGSSWKMFETNKSMSKE